MAYGFKQLPLNGPYPVTLGVIPGMMNSVRVIYDQRFMYNRTAVNSGFFACCKRTLQECDDPRYNWAPVPQSKSEAPRNIFHGILYYLPFFPVFLGLVFANVTQMAIDIRLKTMICEADARAAGLKNHLPYWLGYAWSKSPFPEDLSATIYSDGVHRLPATLWRCQLKAENSENGVNLVCDEIWRLKENGDQSEKK